MVEKVLQLNNEKIIFRVLLGVLIFSLAFYIFCIRATIHNVVARQNLESESSKLTLSIGNQEFEYIAKRNAVTLQLAYSLGFSDAQVKNYISQNPGTKVAFLTR